jgi:iron complex outermembrane receptor protein
MPILKDLEVTGALRYDHYSDFGSTTNPKVSFRYQPAEQLLVRGSYTTGFRAPSLYELDSPITYTNTANSYSDPVLCPGGTAKAGENAAAVCDTQFMTQLGGNKALKPEKSKSWTLGFVVEPMRGTSVGLDFWWIRLQHAINALDQDTIFNNPTKYADLFHRNASGHLSVSGQDCKQTNGAIDPTTCGYITDTNANLGGTNTYGVDLNLASRMKTAAGTFNFDLSGTYINHYEFQTEENGAWTQNAGVYAGGSPVFRWQHTASVAWTRNEWTLGTVNHYKSGYFDQNDPTQVAKGFRNNQVAPYVTTDIYGTWSPTKAMSLTLGVRNVFDQDPPFSNQGATFQVGYDPRFTDPTGRAYYARATYNF